MGRLVREHEREAPVVRGLRKVRVLVNDAAQFKHDGNKMSACTLTYKRCVLMNAMAWAAAPDWASSEWSVLLDYHEWVVLVCEEKKTGASPAWKP
eukprot:858596-Pyramimonas_sp.AAC.1